MKKLYTVILALMILFMMVMSATALESKTINREKGMSAFAVWSETTDNVSTDTFLSVMESNDGTDIYVNICTYDENEWSCKSGYIFTEDNFFEMDKKLDSVDLEAVQIELYEWKCDDNGFCWETPAGTATIEATWVGTGDVTKGSYKWMDRSGNYISKSSSSSLSREAIAEGTLNNEELGTSNFAELGIFKFADMWMQK